MDNTLANGWSSQTHNSEQRYYLQTRNLYKSMLGPHEYTVDHSEKSTVGNLWHR